MSKQNKLWSGEFGSLYQKRNVPTEDNIESRKMLWTHLINYIAQAKNSLPTSYLEVGVGQGQNLMAIADLLREMPTPPKLTGVEINRNACRALARALPSATVIEADWLTCNKQFSAEVVFTSGVLIHVHPSQRLDFMKKMYAASTKYIVCIEYFSPEEREVTYRGQTEALWTADYGSIWLANFKLHCLSYSFFWKRVTGLDNVTCWIFEKVH